MGNLQLGSSIPQPGAGDGLITARHSLDLPPGHLNHTHFFLTTTWLYYFLKGAELTRSSGKGIDPILAVI